MIPRERPLQVTGHAHGNVIAVRSSVRRMRYFASRAESHSTSWSSRAGEISPAKPASVSFLTGFRLWLVSGTRMSLWSSALREASAASSGLASRSGET